MSFLACREASSAEKCSACTTRTRWWRVDSSSTAESTGVFSLVVRQRIGSQRRINESTRTILLNEEKSNMMVSTEILVSTWKDVTDLHLSRSVLPTGCCSSVSASIYICVGPLHQRWLSISCVGVKPRVAKSAGLLADGT